MLTGDVLLVLLMGKALSRLPAVSERVFANTLSATIPTRRARRRRRLGPSASAEVWPRRVLELVCDLSERRGELVRARVPGFESRLRAVDAGVPRHRPRPHRLLRGVLGAARLRR